jgi:predicted dehydrogenase
MNESEKTRLAVCGSGFGLYGHLPAFLQIPDCEVVGIFGERGERILNACQQTGVPFFGDWRAMLDQCRPGAISVAVIPRHQRDIISFALERGISVFAEKPLAVELAPAAQLLELARAKKAAHIVDFLFPEIPQWRRARELLDQGAIGRPHHFQAQWRFLSYDIKNKIHGWKTNPGEGGGALSFFFSHEFHNLEFFLGKIRSLDCRLSRAPDAPGPGETAIALSVSFQSGCEGTVQFDCACPGEEVHSWQFHGDSGSLTLEKTSPSWTRGFELSRRSKTGPKEPVPVPALESDPSCDERVILVKSLAARFIAWQRGSVPARPDFSDGLRVQHLIELARQSSQTKKSVPC